MSDFARILAVAWREFKYTALTKAFIIGTIIFPLIIWGGIAVAPFLVKPSELTLDGTLAMVDPTGRIAGVVTIELDPDRARAQPTLDDFAGADPAEARRLAEEMAQDPAPFGARVHLNLTVEVHDERVDLDALRDRVRLGEFVALAVIDRDALDPHLARRDTVTLFIPPQANPDLTSAVSRALGRAVVRARAEKENIDLEAVRALLRTPAVSTRRLTAEGEAAAGLELQRLLPIAFMILLWIAAFASGNYLLTTTIEEKSNKVMEVLLSAVSPLQLMTGKILGQAVVGLFTVAVYGGLGLAALSLFAMADLIEPIQIVYLAVFFFMAYFMVAAIMAAIGSAVSDLQEAHALLTPAFLVLFLPMILFIPVSQNPNGALAVATSFIPPLTPFVMIVRVTSAEPVPLGQIIASIIIGYLGVVVMVWMAARIFRIGVLMYGKPPSPMELLRWVRLS